MSNVCETVETGIAGITFGDVYDAIRCTKEPAIPAPKNESRPSTVSGPVSAANKCNLDVIRGAK